jgi:hypothetical protein
MEAHPREVEALNEGMEAYNGAVEAHNRAHLVAVKCLLSDPDLYQTDES